MAQGIDSLVRRVLSMDGKSFGAYKSIRGTYRGERFTLHIDRVQGDPFAEPSRVRVVVDSERAEFPQWCLQTPERRVSAADFVNRRAASAFKRLAQSRGSGHSGELEIQRPGQQVLDRTSLRLYDDGRLETRFRVGLPARGRRILGTQAAELFEDDFEEVVAKALCFPALDEKQLREHVETVEDAQALRAQLRERGLVAFVAQDALLPRASGVDDRPLQKGGVPFRTPEALRVTLNTPNRGELSGMGIPEGVTLIVGGGYHGKSTVLRALERGIYEHIPGDGREFVVAREDVFKVRAEDGRRVCGVDIGNFIGDLPGEKDTRRFHTENASGSTSQAATIVEALEVGCRCLLVDEDTSATNFMIRDARMQALIAPEHEPITPFIDRVRGLWMGEGVSSVIVVGGSGDYFDVADHVIAMREYVPGDVTEAAKSIAKERPTGRTDERAAWQELERRRLALHSLDPSSGRRDVRIKLPGGDRLLYGRDEVDVSAVAQLVERGQLRGVAQAMVQLNRRGDADLTPQEVLAWLKEALGAQGLDSLTKEPSGDLAWFRGLELLAVINRLRSLKTA